MPIKQEIMPSEKKHKKLLKQISELDKDIPKPPFFMVIQGSVGSGKTSLLYSILKTYQDKKKPFFDIIIFYNRVKDSDKVWASFDTKKTAVEIYNEYSDEKLGEMMDNIDEVQEARREKKKRMLNLLFVMDDMLYSNISRKGTSTKVDEITINRRHYNISCIITSQNYKALNPNIRTNNLSHMVIMRANLTDLIKISEEHNAGMVISDDFVNMYKKVKEGGQYDFLVVDYQDKPERIFKRNFTDVIQITDDE